MANLSKERRNRMIEKLEELKLQHNDDESIAALNEIENALREKKYGLVWEEHSEAVDDMLKENIPVLVADPERRLCKDENLPWNFIIEGDNLQALYLLEKTHRGKVDCIYIDPPYNTGARDWKYNNDYVDGNDEYRHSKWLSMMKSRLLVAKRLLNPNESVLIVTIDEKEYLHLGCLIEELFPEANIQMISSVINRKGSTRRNEFSRCVEYIFYVMIGEAYPCDNETDMIGISAHYDEPVIWDEIRRRGSSIGSLRKGRPGLFYPIFIDKNSNKVVGTGESPLYEIDRHTIKAPEGTWAAWPLRPNGEESCWQISQVRLAEQLAEGTCYLASTDEEHERAVIRYLKDGDRKKVIDGKLTVVGRDEKTGRVLFSNDATKMSRPKDVWNMKSHDAGGSGGMGLINEIFHDRRFTFPKSVYAVHDTIRFFIRNNPYAVIVDFFAGSGTTMHAVNLLNAEDGGHRKCVMVTNNEVSESESKELSEKGYHPGDEEWEEQGIAKHVTWPRTVCTINGVNVNGEPLKGNYLDSDIPMADGFDANVKYFKCDWTPRRPEDYLLSNALCLHVKELIELQTAQEVDGVKNVLILSKSDYKRIFGKPESFAAVEHVWVNENLVFSSAEMRVLRKKRFCYIPREYFSQELKEVGEYV